MAKFIQNKTNKSKIKRTEEVALRHFPKTTSSVSHKTLMLKTDYQSSNSLDTNKS
jgi:hypothetical protein